MGLMRKGMGFVKMGVEMGVEGVAKLRESDNGRSGLKCENVKPERDKGSGRGTEKNQPAATSSYEFYKNYVVPQSFRLAFEVLVIVVITKCEKYGVDLEGVGGRDLLGMIKRMEERFERGSTEEKDI